MTPLIPSVVQREEAFRLDQELRSAQVRNSDLQACEVAKGSAKLVGNLVEVSFPNHVTAQLPIASEGPLGEGIRKLRVACGRDPIACERFSGRRGFSRQSLKRRVI